MVTLESTIMDHGTSETLSRDLLAALELKNVAITAALGPDGKLSPIGGLWEKLGQQAAIELARRGLLRIVVVAEGQKGVPEEYLREDAEPLRVIRAESVADAIGQLHVQAAPYQSVRQSERKSCATMDLLGRTPVPLEQHYQVLPLLQEIKEEQLPRSADSGDHSEEGALRQVDILRWEEQVREEHKQYERVALTEAFEDYSKVVKDAKTTIPRLVILGPPGSGKTTVMQYLAWLAVNQQLKWNDRPLLPTRVRLHDWEAWLRKHSKTGLADYLSQHYRDQKHSPTAEQWRHWLHRGDVLVLLDGLDELDDDPAFTATLTTTLSTFTACPTVLSCRTVSYQRYQSLGPDFAVFTLAGLDEVQRDAYIRAFPAEQPVYFSPEALIDQLSQMPQLHPLVANPLLLSIICFVVDDPQGVKLPATHSALYERAVNKLLDRYPNRVEVPYPGVKPDFYRKRVIVEQIALSLFAKGKNTLTFTSGELAEALERSIEVKYPASLADPIREDLIQNSGLLRGTPEHGFFFLYLTLQEFLAAGALARLVNERGMQEELTVAGITRTIYEWVDRKAWDPRWQEVIVLLTGQLKDPAPLLELLADEKKDDYFRHRLALAALCLPELSEGYRQTHAEIIDHITDVAFFCWWEHEMNDTEAAVPHLARACPALAQVNGRIEDKPLQNWLVQRLGTPDKEGETAIKAIGHLVRSAATKEFVTALAECLCDGEASVRRAAARVVGEIGSKAVNKEFLGALAKYLGDGEAAVRWAAIRAVGEIGSAAATDGILAALAERLGDEKASVQKAAVWAVGEIGSAAAKDGILTTLVERLGDEKASVRKAAVRAVGEIGSAAATDGILAALAERLGDGKASVRQHTVRALFRIRRAAANKEFLNKEFLTVLAKRLGDADSDLRRIAVRAVESLGSAAAKPEIITTLVERLGDGESSIRERAVRAVGQLGSKAATSEILAALAERLVDEKASVRKEAVRVVNEIGSAAAKKEFIAALAERLCDADEGVQEAALLALGEIRSEGSTKEILMAIAERLGDGKASVRKAAVRAVGRRGLATITNNSLEALHHADSNVREEVRKAMYKIDTSATTQEVLTALAGRLCNADSNVWEAALEIVGACGTVFAVSEIRPALAERLGDERASVRKAAVRAVGEIGSNAASEAVLTALAERLCDEDKDVRKEALQAVESVGSNEAILSALAKRIGDKGRSHFIIRDRTATLDEQIDDSNKDEQCGWAALQAVKSLGSKAATSEILTALAERLMGDDERHIRSVSIEAVSALGRAAATKEILAILAVYMGNEDDQVRWTASSAVDSLGNVAATKDILAALAALVDCLIDADMDVRKAAVQAVKSLGSAAAIQDILTALAALVECLIDADGDVRKASVRVVSSLRSAVDKQEILTALVERLGDPDIDMRWTAYRTVCALGAVASKDFLTTLTARLSAREEHLWKAHFSRITEDLQGALVFLQARMLNEWGRHESLATLAEQLGNKFRKDKVRAVDWDVSQSRGTYRLAPYLVRDNRDQDSLNTVAEKLHNFGLDQSVKLYDDNISFSRESYTEATPKLLAALAERLRATYGKMWKAQFSKSLGNKQGALIALLAGALAAGALARMVNERE